jgi:hypothetical protein
VAEITPKAVLDRLCDALNRRDIGTLVHLFHPSYQSEQPAHPGRSFRGIDGVRRNWGWVFQTFPDFRADLLRWTYADGVFWTEWRWHGTHRHDGKPMDVRGVALFGLGDGRITWGRLYMESID